MERVAIIGYAQTRHQADIQKTREDMVFEVVKAAVRMAGITREEIGATINASGDLYDGRTISNVFLNAAIGAFLKDDTKVEADGAFGAFYGMMKILSGVQDVVLVVANSQGSTFNPHQVSTFMLEPTFDRQIEVLNDISAAALQARWYMSKYGVSEAQIARVSVKNLRNAVKNPNAHRKIPNLTVEGVLNSKIFYEPIRELTMSPISDGACALVLASERKAKELTDVPVWVEGVGSCQGPYLRDRDWKLESLGKAARSAYEMAGIKDPFSELDVAEVTERFAHEELLIYEALGLCEEGKGGTLIEEGATEIDGRLPVNPSGGTLSADPILATGLVRIVEAAKQIRGEAGDYQIRGVKKALAHGQNGMCAQSNIVFVLSGEG